MLAFLTHEMTLEGGEGGELDAEGGGQWSKTSRAGEGPKVVLYS